MRRILLPSALCLAAFGIAGAADLLRFEFNDSAHLADQAGGLPAGTVIGPVQASSAIGSADFKGGVIKLADFPGPQGPFSIESRFRLRSYPVEDSRFCSDILNTATWNSDPPETSGTPTQGLVHRVGGGYQYPILPQSRYATAEEWRGAGDAWSHIQSGKFSTCFADFVIGRKADATYWKEAYSDRCVHLGAWTHMATVWDGKDMRIYLDGLDATDTLRIKGAGDAPRIDSLQTAFIGGRKDRSWDPRRFDGDIDFVRMEDRAWTAEEVRAKYKDTFVPGTRDSLCHGVAVPSFPEAGRVCLGKIKFKIEIANHGACTDPRFLAGFLAGDSIEIELSKEPSFDPIAFRARFAMLSFELGIDELGSLAGYTGPIYWRVRLIPAVTRTALAKSAAAAPAEWSPARPIVVDMASATGLRRAVPRLVRAEKGLVLRGASEPALYDLAGHRVPARFLRLAEGAGAWRLEEMPAASGLLLAR